MATINKITEVIAAIKTIYPYYAKETDVATLVKTWNVLLNGYSDEEVEKALYLSLQTCKMPPTPADLIEKLTAARASLEPSDEELWEELTKAIKKGYRLVYRFQFNYVEPNGLTEGQNARNAFERLWESLPEKVRMYLGGKGEFQRLAQNNDEEDLKFERNRFLKTMPTIQKRTEYRQLQLAIETSATASLPEGVTL